MEKIMKQSIDSRGYYMVPLRNNGIRKTPLVHRIVAKSFVVNKDNKGTVNHRNGIKTDNKIENLEWCTQKENVIHAYKNGLCKDKSGTNNGRSLLNENKVLEIRKDNLRPIRLLAEKYNVSSSCIESIIKRKTWVNI